MVKIWLYIHVFWIATVLLQVISEFKTELQENDKLKDDVMWVMKIGEFLLSFASTLL